MKNRIFFLSIALILVSCKVDEVDKPCCAPPRGLDILIPNPVQTTEGVMDPTTGKVNYSSVYFFTVTENNREKKMNKNSTYIEYLDGEEKFLHIGIYYSNIVNHFSGKISSPMTFYMKLGKDIDTLKLKLRGNTYEYPEELLINDLPVEPYEEDPCAKDRNSELCKVFGNIISDIYIFNKTK